MNDPLHKDEHEALDPLYRDAGGVEPSPGLDRIVHARAEQALRRRHRAPRPWVAGAATAAVAVLALVTILRQTPLPEAPPPQFEVESSAEAPPPAAAGPESRTVAADAAAPLRESFAAPRSRAGDGPEAADQARRPATLSAEALDRVLDQVEVRGSRLKADAEAEARPSFEAPAPTIVERLRALLVEGRAEEARLLLESLESEGNLLQLPKDLEAALRAPAEPDDDCGIDCPDRESGDP